MGVSFSSGFLAGLAGGGTEEEEEGREEKMEEATVGGGEAEERFAEARAARLYPFRAYSTK